MSLYRDSLRRALLRYAPTASSERVDLALAEILSDLKLTRASNTDVVASSASSVDSGANANSTRSGSGDNDTVLTQEAWCNVMASWLQVRFLN
jgi:hypothetical protein